MKNNKRFFTFIVFLSALSFYAKGHCVTPSIDTELVTGGLSNPTSITNAGDGSGRLFITLQQGKILIYNGTKILSQPFLDITSLVSCCDERGLLSIAFHPDYSNNGFFYIDYTDIDGNTVIARYSVSSDADVADKDSAQTIIKIHQPFANHNGGGLQFGPDRYLYIGMGDGGSAGDPKNNAQSLKSLLGKILRIDIDGGTPYSIPPTNPFIKKTKAKKEIWAYGLRNPWRFSFDRLTGSLFIGDVGQNEWEEVDFEPASSKGGKNYGWRRMEGKHCYNPTTSCNNGSLTLPILEYSHAVGCSVTGGYRYRGTEITPLYGYYLYSDYCSGTIWGAKKKKSGKWKSQKLLDTEQSVSTFGEGEDGEIYFATYDSVNGAIYRIIAGK